MDTITKRSSNFSCEETDLLFNLVNEYRNVLERKETDRATIDQKNRIWENIAKEFNEQNLGEFRSVKVLRKRFSNAKTKNTKLTIISNSDTDIEDNTELDDTESESWKNPLFIEPDKTTSRSMELAEEKHNLEMKILKKEHEIRMKMMKEKHQLEIELLKYKIRVENKKLE